MMPISDAEWKLVIRRMRLSPRQADVVRLLLTGLEDKEIAASLGISFSTVRTHLRQLFAREHVDDRLKLVLRVFAVARHSV